MSNVREVLDSLGIEVVRERTTRRGKHELIAVCPHHFGGTDTDSNPSWSINADTGAHFCQGCGFRGGLEYLLHEVGHLDWQQAKEQTDRGDWALQRIRRRDPWDGALPVPIPPMSEARVKSYDEPPADLLEARRINIESARRFGLRYRHDRDAWVIPIRLPNGRLVGMQLKGVHDRYFRNVPAGVEKSSTLFGIGQLPADEVVVVESPLDAVRLDSLGYRAVATYGAWVSATQVELLIRNTDRVMLALDNDKAGRENTMRLLGRWPSGRRNRAYADISERIPVRIVNYSGPAKDVGDMEDAEIHHTLTTARSPLLYLAA